MSVAEIGSHKLARFFLPEYIQIDVRLRAENSKSMVDRGRRRSYRKRISGWAEGPRYSDGKKLISGWRTLALAAR